MSIEKPIDWSKFPTETEEKNKPKPEQSDVKPGKETQTADKMIEEYAKKIKSAKQEALEKIKDKFKEEHEGKTPKEIKQELEHKGKAPQEMMDDLDRELQEIKDKETKKLKAVRKKLGLN